MKLSTSQRKLYLLSAVLLVLTLGIMAAWGLLGTLNSAPDVSPAVIEQQLPESSDVPEYQTTDMPESSPDAPTIRTVVYYQDNYGYLVPVTRTIPAEEGVAKATLSLMVSSAYNDMEAARLGLRTILPENTAIDLDVSGGTARVDLGKEVLAMPDAETEANMVSAVVQTLTEFPTVDRVEFLVNGQKISQLPFGTDLTHTYERGTINLESMQEGSDPNVMRTVSLYFPGDSSSLIVPVTRPVYGPCDLNTAVLELTKGPSVQSPLENALPSGCGLIDVRVENGVATLNFTRDFINIAQESDGGRVALRALVLTCTQFEGIDSVKIEVDGEPYDPGQSTLAVPTFVNDASSLTQEFIRTQTASILDVE